MTGEVRFVPDIPVFHAESVKSQSLPFCAVFRIRTSVAVLDIIMRVLAVRQNKTDGKLRFRVQLAAQHDEFIHAYLLAVLIKCIRENDLL